MCPHWVEHPNPKCRSILYLMLYGISLIDNMIFNIHLFFLVHIQVDSGMIFYSYDYDKDLPTDQFSC